MKWRWRSRFGSRILAVSAAAASAACSSTWRSSLPETILAIDRSIDALTKPSADFRTILQGLPRQLPSNADASVTATIGRFLDRAPADGADFRCGSDFLRLRAREELIRIEERLQGNAGRPMEPQICYAAPFAIDLTQAPSTVEIYGYDLDRVSLEMVLVAGDGYRDVSTALIPRTHFHVTLQLGDGGVRLRADARSLGLTWGNLIHHSIPIVGPKTPLCSCTIEEIPAGREVEYAPPPVNLDRRAEARAGSPSSWANALVDFQSNELAATLCMTVAAPNDGRAVRSGCVRAFVLTVDPDRTIEWLFGRQEGRASYAPGAEPRAESEASNGDALLRSWKFAGFGADSSDPRATLELGKIRLVTTGGGDGCISPIAYMEARRTGAIGTAAERALDRQLLKLDPEILGLRPRFAPGTR